MAWHHCFLNGGSDGTVVRAEAVRRAREVNKLLDEISHMLAERRRTMLGGGNRPFSAADICFYGYVHSTGDGGFDLDRFPAGWNGPSAAGL
jgi:hypothetical protein